MPTIYGVYTWREQQLSYQASVTLAGIPMFSAPSHPIRTLGQDRTRQVLPAFVRSVRPARIELLASQCTDRIPAPHRTHYWRTGHHHDRAPQQRPELKPTPHPDTRAFIPTSVVLQRLHDEAPENHFTLGWLMANLSTRSFGIVMLLLALVAIAPTVSIVAGLLLFFPAFQMIAGQNAPVFPRRITVRPIPTPHLAALVQRAVPALSYLEKLIHPRWHTAFKAMAIRRLVGAAVLMLSITVAFTPIPLSNVVPALVIILISLAYLEEDGLVLSVALLAAAGVLAVAGISVWATIRGAAWICGLW